MKHVPARARWVWSKSELARHAHAACEFVWRWPPEFRQYAGQARPDSRGGGGLGDAVSQFVYCTVHIANSRYMRTSHVLARRVGVQQDLHSSLYAL